MPVEIASAYVTLIPSMKGFGSRLSKETGNAVGPAGKAAGKKFSDSMSPELEKSGKDGGKRIGSGLIGALKTLAGPAAAVLAGGALKAGFDDLTNLASDFNETASMAKVIFGAQAGAIDKWASGAATNLGLSKSAALDAAASFGDMFRQIGFTGDASAKMSTKVVQAAADLGSFKNLPTADVAEKIEAAFRGEYDSLQAVIPNINAARVEHEALAITSKKASKELTAQDKATAVLAIVQKDGARAMGDFARTSSGAANATKIQTARLEDLKTQAGQALLPMRILGIRAFSFLLDKALQLGPTLGRVRDALGSFAGYVKGYVAPAVAYLVPRVQELAGKALPYLQAALGYARSAVGAISVAFQSASRFVAAHSTAFSILAGAIVGGLAAFVAIRGVMLAYSGAMRVVAFATKAYAAVQAALNFVLSANPIGLVVVAIGLLVGALIVAYRKSDTFRLGVQVAFALVSAAVRFAWEKAIRPAFTAWWAYMQFLGRAATFLWERAFRPALRFIAAAFTSLVGTILNGAAAAFGWVPGLGPKLKTAAAAFNRFAAEVNRSLNGVKSKTVTITATARIGSGPMANKFLPMAAGGPVPMMAGAVRGKDSVPILAMPDEFVIRRDGSNLSDALRHFGAPGYANGGLVTSLKTSNGLRDFAPRMNAALDKRVDAALRKIIGEQDGVGPSYGGGKGAHGGTRASLIAFGRMLVGRGFSVGEGPSPFGPVHRVHTKNSKHYQGRAIDVNHGAGTSLSEQRAIDGIVGLARGYGLDAIWRRPGHFNHAHFSYDQGGILGPNMTGVNRTGKPERVLTPTQTESFDRLVALLESGGGMGGGITGGTFYAYDPHDLVAEQRKRSRDAAALHGMGV